MWLTIRGYVAGVVAVVACPCHLPITLPLAAQPHRRNWLRGVAGRQYHHRGCHLNWIVHRRVSPGFQMDWRNRYDRRCLV